jgi:hypothetical protein
MPRYGGPVLARHLRWFIGGGILLPQLRGHWSKTVFGWFKSEQRERRRKVRLDRKHLEARSRRFLKNFLNADQARKPNFYRAVEAATEQCYPADALLSPELDDAQIAEATSTAAMKIVLERIAPNENDRVENFVTDAFATVGIAYHRAAGVYTLDKEMEKLGTAAVHLLTMANSYISAQKEKERVQPRQSAEP